MNLFIDTNIYLSFFYLTGDDLEELRKLILLCKQKRVRLIIPMQVIYEHDRNRENKLFEALKILKDQRLNLQFPQICRQYPEYEKLIELQNKYEKIHKQLLEKIIIDEKGRQLLADKILEELFACSEVISEDEEVRKLARDRFDRGNPPGKDGSYGDAIIWETILKSIPDEEELYFVSDDKDFISNLNQDEMKEFLVNEWAKLKHSKITFYRRLSSFTGDHFPEIKISTEYEKELLITDLFHSGTFASTHLIISKLNKYVSFNEEQLKRLVSAAINNSQVNLIINDPDVKLFYLSILDRYCSKIYIEETLALVDMIKPENEEEKRILESIEVPF